VKLKLKLFGFVDTVYAQCDCSLTEGALLYVKSFILSRVNSSCIDSGLKFIEVLEFRVFMEESSSMQFLYLL
jgi:hypothetical protein